MSKAILAGLTLKELAKRVWNEANKDNVWGAAAQLAYYFLFALFPMLIFLTTLVGFLSDFQQTLLTALAKTLPPEVMNLVVNTLHDVTLNRSGKLLSFGILGTIWAASGGVVSLMNALNIAYQVKEGRSFWKQRLVSVGLTIGLSLFIVVGILLIMFGDRLSLWFAKQLELGSSFKLIWGIVDYLLGLALLLSGIDLIYFFGPNVKQKWRWTSVGGIFAVLSIVTGSLLFSFYLRYAPSYSATYGSLGAVMVLMLWLYIFGLVLLIGGEINSEIYHASNTPIVEKEPATD